MADFISALLNTLDQLPFAWLLLVVLSFTTFETSLLLGLLVPGDVVMLAAGAATSNMYELASVVVFAGIGTLVGQSGGYVVGRVIGHRIRSSFLKKWITAEHWQQAEKLLQKGAGTGILAAQFLPFVHATLPVAAGITRLNYRRFVFWASIGSLLWAMVYVGAGALFGQVARAYPSYIGLVLLLALALIFALWFIGYLIDRLVLKPRRKRK